MLLLFHPGAKPPPLVNPVIGKAITLCVNAGMTQEEVVTLFGPPESSDGFGSGPPDGGVEVDSLYYRRYGASVSFMRRLGLGGAAKARFPSHMSFERVDGGLE